MNLDKLRVIAGHHAIQEVILVRPRSIRAAWFVSNWSSSQELRALHKFLSDQKIKIELQSPQNLEKKCKSHQGAILFVDTLPQFELRDLKIEKTCRIVLVDGLEDPHNLGAILRTSWLMGVQALLIPQDRAVGLTATVHKIACGGVEHVPVLVCNSFAQSLEQLKEMDFWVFGLSHKSKKTIHQWKAPEKLVLCIGSEEKGLRTTTEKLCDELLSIPQCSATASYNASVAAAISVSEALRQHQILFQ